MTAGPFLLALPHSWVRGRYAYFGLIAFYGGGLMRMRF